MFYKLKNLFSKNDFYNEERFFFSEDNLKEIKMQILESSYLKENNLNYNFSGSLGFSIVFKKGFENKVIGRFPAFESYLSKVINEKTNAYYLNPLVMKSGSKIQKHMDHSLRSYYKNISIPETVSVLYVSIPKMEGGNFILYDETKFIAKIKPEKNKLLNFKGYLKHEVTPVIIKQEDEFRVSLICEQYSLDSQILEQIPDFLIRSSAGFGDFLKKEMEINNEHN